MIEWPRLEIARHPLAPMYGGKEDPYQVLQYALETMTSQNGFQTTEEIRQLLRQTGLVSLWFYLKFICGFAGPYDQLNGELHVEMCNYRQMVAVTPGIKGAMFFPRSALKSTIGTHGANAWELLRNPDLRIGCASETYDRALDFVMATVAVYRDNSLHKWLYPEWEKVNRDDISLVLGNRKKRYVEPSLKAITAGGSTQGGHYDLFNADDIVGDDMLNSDFSATADMLRMGNWLHSNLKTLVVQWSKSRVLVSGTRYCIDDPYEKIMLHSKVHLGHWEDEDYPVDPAGDWITEFWPVKVGKDSIWDEKYPVAELEKMAVENPQLYWTQYANSVRSVKPGDFGQYRLGKATMTFSEAGGFRVQLENGGEYPLSDADVVCAGDPAASSRRATSRTSKSAVVVVARFPSDEVVVLEAQEGYVEPTRFFDWFYQYRHKYGILMRSPYVEAQAGFKAFIPMARREALIRGEELNVQGVPALGEKETTIRNILQPYLVRNKLYAREEIWQSLAEQLKLFPSSRMDLLDALKIAVFKTSRPEGSEGDGCDDEDDEDRNPNSGRNRRYRVNGISGY